MSVRVRVDEKALRSFLAKDPRSQHALDDVVQAIQDKAEELSPVGAPEATDRARRRRSTGRRRHREFGGEYKGRFSWRRYPLSRRLKNTDPFAHLVEWGSINNRAYAVMRRAVRSLGLQLKERPKHGG